MSWVRAPYEAGEHLDGRMCYFLGTGGGEDGIDCKEGALESLGGVKNGNRAEAASTYGERGSVVSGDRVCFGPVPRVRGPSLRQGTAGRERGVSFVQIKRDDVWFPDKNTVVAANQRQPVATAGLPALLLRTSQAGRTP